MRGGKGGAGVSASPGGGCKLLAVGQGVFWLSRVSLPCPLETKVTAVLG